MVYVIKMDLSNTIMYYNNELLNSCTVTTFVVITHTHTH